MLIVCLYTTPYQFLIVKRIWYKINKSLYQTETINGFGIFISTLISNVGGMGDIVGVKVKG